MPGNHSKKPSDRRDPLTQTPTQSNRKNMQGRQPKDTHFNNNSNNKRPAHVGMNGFNGAEVSGFLNQRYSDTLAAFHNSYLDGSVRPVKHESQEKAWSNKGSAWGQKGIPTA
ncbi:hypothetical protein [Absidia glauca]|uniref:Uncharacterized protein n=1 Tax=Absidia glauca TaxID=4829 RepID=A0A163IVK6_ABSGL|nr:hypothetical protein [Absidia glauca]